jgi:hypothetical protein
MQVAKAPLLASAAPAAPPLAEPAAVVAVPVPHAASATSPAPAIGTPIQRAVRPYVLAFVMLRSVPPRTLAVAASTLPPKPGNGLYA